MKTGDSNMSVSQTAGPAAGGDLKDRVVQDEAVIGKLMHDLRQIILPIGVALSVEKDHNRLLERILEKTKGLCNADAATLYLRTDDHRLRFEIMRTDSLGLVLGGSSPNRIPYEPLPLYDSRGQPNERNIASFVALHGKVVNIPDVYNSDKFDFSATKEYDRKNHYRSVCTLTVPLRNSEGESIGVMQLFNPKDPDTGAIVPFTEYQQLVCESLASQAAIVLSNQALIKHEQELLMYEREMEIGRKIQQGFMPSVLPQPPGWDIAAAFSAARVVAGDFYDVFPLADGRLGFAVADVCDKGVGAALFGALSRSLLRSFARQYIPRGRSCDADCKDCPPQVMADAVRSWAERERIDLVNPLCVVNMLTDYITTVHGDANMFLTLFFGVLNLSDGGIMYVNGGHEPGTVLTANGVRRAKLTPTGPAVGIVTRAGMRTAKEVLHSGETLVIHTDGVTDARNRTGEPFTRERLMKLLDGPAESAQAILDRVLKAVRAHIGETDQYDDITMFVIRRTA